MISVAEAAHLARILTNVLAVNQALPVYYVIVVWRENTASTVIKIVRKPVSHALATPTASNVRSATTMNYHPRAETSPTIVVIAALTAATLALVTQTAPPVGHPTTREMLVKTVLMGDMVQPVHSSVRQTV